MQCKNCGKVIADTAKFCPGCGWKVESAPETAGSEPPMQIQESVESGTIEQTQEARESGPTVQSQETAGSESTKGEQKQSTDTGRMTESSVNMDKIRKIGIGVLAAFSLIIAFRSVLYGFQEFFYGGALKGLGWLLDAAGGAGMAVVLVMLVLGGLKEKEKEKNLYFTLTALSAVLAVFGIIRFVGWFFAWIFSGYLNAGYFLMTFLMALNNLLMTLTGLGVILGFTYCLLQLTGEAPDLSMIKQKFSSNQQNTGVNYGAQNMGANYNSQNAGGNYGSQGVGMNHTNGTSNYNTQGTKGSRPLKTDRGLLGYILLSIITCGIYSYYFIYTVACDVNIACEGDGQSTSGLLKFILFSILTCGIYAYWWEYSLGNRLAENAPRYGMSFMENGTTVLMWQIFGAFLCGIGPFIAMNIIIKNTNSICMAYNRKQGFIA